MCAHNNRASIQGAPFGDTIIQLSMFQQWKLATKAVSRQTMLGFLRFDTSTQNFKLGANTLAFWHAWSDSAIHPSQTISCTSVTKYQQHQHPQPHHTHRCHAVWTSGHGSPKTALGRCTRRLLAVSLPPGLVDQELQSLSVPMVKGSTRNEHWIKPTSPEPKGQKVVQGCRMSVHAAKSMIHLGWQFTSPTLDFCDLSCTAKQAEWPWRARLCPSFALL